MDYCIYFFPHSFSILWFPPKTVSWCFIRLFIPVYRIIALPYVSTYLEQCHDGYFGIFKQTKIIGIQFSGHIEMAIYNCWAIRIYLFLVWVDKNK